MGQISYMPISQEEQPSSGLMPAADPSFIPKSDKDMAYDNCPQGDHTLDEYFSSGEKTLKDNDGDK